MKKVSRKFAYWKSQPPVDYIDTSLVINTWETVVADLSEGKPARLWLIHVEQTNNGATDETIELEITINGTTYTCTLTGIASGEINYVRVDRTAIAGDFRLIHTATGVSVGYAHSNDGTVPFTADSIELIRVRQTTDVDITSAQIEINIVWDMLEP